MTAPPALRAEIATPCPVSWDDMPGTDRVRACALCQLNVYNLSGMAGREARRLIHETEGRLCVRYYQRADGTVITRDCPEAAGVASAERAAPQRRVLTAVALLALLAGADTLTQSAWASLHSALYPPGPQYTSVLGGTSQIELFLDDVKGFVTIPIRPRTLGD